MHISFEGKEKKPLLDVLLKPLIRLCIAINIRFINITSIMVISSKSSWKSDTLIVQFFFLHFKVSLCFLECTVTWMSPAPERWRTIAHLFKDEISLSRLFLPPIFRKEFRSKYIYKNFSNISGGH